MKTTVTLDEAVTQLPRLVQEARRGKEVILTEGDRPVVRLVPVAPEKQEEAPRARFGSAKGLIVYMAADFDGPLDDFREYME